VSRQSIHTQVDRAFQQEDPADRAAMLYRLQRDLNAPLAEAVLAARELGYSWTQIGDALGVSKQAILQRFGPGGRLDVEQLRAKKQPRKRGA
jgi:DNA-directed RNA polymerase specialized sigma24 family protein